MSIAETMLNSALKTIDFQKLLSAPQAQEALGLLRGIAGDFRDLKTNQIDILARLDKIEAALEMQMESVGSPRADLSKFRAGAMEQ
jgi:hypothetical protein